MARKTISGGKSEAGALIRKLRKPVAPPTRVAEDERKYSRARERQRLLRETDGNQGPADRTGNSKQRGRSQPEC